MQHAQLSQGAVPQAQSHNREGGQVVTGGQGDLKKEQIQCRRLRAIQATHRLKSRSLYQ